jgi:hypothetical protein
METLPIAAFLVRQGVERQFKLDRVDRPVATRRPVRQTRLAIAASLDRAAKAIAPAGYHPA